MSKVNLIENCVSPDVLIRYTKAYDHFIDWCSMSGLKLSVYNLDPILYEYFQQSARSNPRAGNRTNCTYARNFIRLYFPELPLLLSQQALKGWCRMITARVTNPMPRALALLMARHFMTIRRLDFAVITLVGFDCYLRTSSEFINIHVADITLPGQAVASTGLTNGCLRLRKTKTGEEQSVLLRDDVSVTLLRKLYHKRNGHLRLLSCTDRQYSKAFHFFLKSIDLEDLFRVYSLRHGGATHDFCKLEPIEDIKTRGRWRRLQTCERYVNVGRTLAYSLRFSPKVSSMMDRLRKDNSLVYRNLDGII